MNWYLYGVVVTAGITFIIGCVHAAREAYDLEELILLGLLAILTPVMVGFLWPPVLAAGVIIGLVNGGPRLMAWDRARRYDLEHEARKDWPGTKPGFLPPRDALDDFCTCPACYMLGTHAILSSEYKKNGTMEMTRVGTWANPYIREIQTGVKPGIYTKRKCWSCGNEWSVRS